MFRRHAILGQSLVAIVLLLGVPLWTQSENRVAKFDANGNLVNSIMYDNGPAVGVGTTTPNAMLDVAGDINSAGAVNTGTQYNIGGGRVLSVAGTNNTFLGISAGGSTTGAGNSFFGNGAGQSNTTGFSNAAFGYSAGFFTSTTCCNAFFGAFAGASNLAIGNSFFGYGAGAFNTIGSSNAFFGNNAGGSNDTGTSNTFFGREAGFWNTTGSSNTFVGLSAGTTNVMGNNNTYIGSGADGSDDLTNATAIGYNAQATESNTLILGNGASVGIGTSAPDNLLTVNGTADKPGGGSWGTFSDGRLKTIQGNFHAGLKEVLQLNPVVYRYKEQNALGIKDTDEHVGFVAQEVEQVIPDAVSKNAKGYRIVNNDPILWTMLNAIKEQQILIQKQEHRVDLQRAQIAQLASQVAKIQAASGDRTRRTFRSAKAHAVAEKSRAKQAMVLAVGSE